MKEYIPLSRRTAYYETDQMGIVHHANYIRWFEEARDDCARQYGIDYARVEAEGILMPVIAVDCVYKVPAKYDEVVEISARPCFFNGARLRYAYEVRSRESGTVHAVGSSEHCFIDASGRKPLNLRRRMPEYCKALSALVEACAAEAENGGRRGRK